MPVPGQMNDIKVLITKKAFTLDVIFKPAARFEFSANEVRLRLANCEQFKGKLLVKIFILYFIINFFNYFRNFIIK